MCYEGVRQWLKEGRVARLLLRTRGGQYMLM